MKIDINIKEWSDVDRELIDLLWVETKVYKSQICNSYSFIVVVIIKLLQEIIIALSLSILNVFKCSDPI